MQQLESGNLNSLGQRIADNRETLTQSQKAVASFLTDHPDEAAFMTVLEVARAARVSESTVVRFAYELNYSGYPHLRAALQDMVKSRLDAASRLGGGENGDLPVPHRTMQMAMDSIQAAMSQNTVETMELVVSSMIKANKVLIMGARSARIVGQFFACNLRWVMPKKHIATVDPDELCEQLLGLEPGDLALAISITRYTKRSIDALQVARERGATTVAVTDSVFSPLAARADIVLVAPGSLVGYADSFVATLTVFEALLVMASRANPAASAKSLRELEAIWERFELFAQGSRSQVGHPGR